MSKRTTKNVKNSSASSVDSNMEETSNTKSCSAKACGSNRKCK